MDQKHNKLSEKIVTELTQYHDFLPFAIKRARASRLYDYNSNKYLDFYLNNGSVFLGYQPKSLSTQLKNTLNYGFYNFYPHHLMLRAKKELLDFFEEKISSINSSDWDIYFFSDPFALKNFLSYEGFQKIDLIPDSFVSHIPSYLEEITNSSSTKNTFYVGNDLNSLKNLPLSYNSFVVDSILGNGFPIITFVFEKTAISGKYLHSPTCNIFSFKAILETLKALKNKENHPYFLNLLAPYKENVTYLGLNCFNIKALEKEDMTKLHLKLLKKCILINPTQNMFFLSLQTTKHEIDYLFKTLTKVRN